jgi:thiol-disulfide isomerase/thioredoxin
MDDNRNSYAPAWPVLPRRSLISGSVALMAIASLPRQAKSEEFENPPVLRNARRQFVVVMPRQQLPTTLLPSLNGKNAKLAREPGKILLINFWATWCGLCRIELPALARGQEAMPNVSVVAISTDGSNPAKIATYLKNIGAQNLRILVDVDGRVSSANGNDHAIFHLYEMPVIYLVTPSGWIAGFISGVTDWTTPDAHRLLAYYASA